MDVKVDIDKDTINAAVTKAIVDSAIGDEIRKQIEEYIKQFTRAWDNPIKKIVEQVASRAVYDIVRNEYEDRLKAEVRLLTTDEVVSEITRKAFDAWLDKT